MAQIKRNRQPSSSQVSFQFMKARQFHKMSSTALQAHVDIWFLVNRGNSFIVVHCAREIAPERISSNLTPVRTLARTSSSWTWQERAENGFFMSSTCTQRLSNLLLATTGLLCTCWPTLTPSLTLMSHSITVGPPKCFLRSRCVNIHNEITNITFGH